MKLLKAMFPFLFKSLQADISSIIHTSCDTLSLEGFERCYEQGDLTALIKDKTKTVSEETLISVWDDIQTEYCDLSADDNFKSYLNKRSRELAIKIKIHHVQMLVGSLALYGDQNYIKALRQYGYGEHKYKFTPESLDTDMKRVLMSLAQEELKLQEVQREIELHNENHKGKSIDKGYFNSMIVEIEKHMGFRIKKNEVTVAEYCNYLNNLRTHHKNRKDG